jgi:UDP-3-O-[3-hydroxymyristoyl] glucosamine N-acyltransferase
MARAGFTLGELAEVLHARLDGDPGRVVTGVAPLESAEPHQISFLTDLRYRSAADASRAGAFLAPRDVRNLPAPTLGCDAPQQALIELLRLFHPPVPTPAGVDRTAVVAPEARIDPSATVGPLCVVEGRAVIGARVRLHALVHVGAATRCCTRT